MHLVYVVVWSDGLEVAIEKEGTIIKLVEESHAKILTEIGFNLANIEEGVVCRCRKLGGK